MPSSPTTRWADFATGRPGRWPGFGGTHIPQDIAEILNSVSGILGKSKKGLVGVLNDQMTGYLNWLGLGNAQTAPASSGSGMPTIGLFGGSMVTDTAAESGGMTKTLGSSESFGSGDIDVFGFGAGDTLVSETGMPFRIQGSKSNAPDMPFKPDWTLAGMHDGKLDDDDDPSAPSGGQGTSKGMEPGELHQWGEPPTPAPAAPAGATAGVGSQPAQAPPSVPASPNPPGAGQDPRVGFVKGAKEYLTIPTSTRQEKDVPFGHPDYQAPGSKKYVDPDQAGGVIVVRPEQIDMKLNGRKQPVNPNGGVGVDEPLDPSTIPAGAGGIDPTVALYDPDAMIFVASDDVPPKVSTAPIDYAQGYGPGSQLPVTEGGSGDTTHTTHTTRDWP